MGIIPGNELFFLILLPASLFDLYRYKVPNAFFAAILIISLIRQLEVQGLSGLYPWLTGIIIPFILCYFFYRARMLGAADCKMFSVIGSFTDCAMLLQIMFVSIVAAAVLSVFKMILMRNFVRRFQKLFFYITVCLKERKLRPYYDREAEGDDGIIPFTVAISIAVILCLY